MTPGADDLSAAGDRLCAPPSVTSTDVYPARVAEKRRGPDWTGILGKLGPVLGLLFVAGLFGILRPAEFLTLDNLELILLQTAVVGTAALGMTLIIVSGGIDLSVGSNIALSNPISNSLETSGLRSAFPVPPTRIPGMSPAGVVTVCVLKNVMASRKLGRCPDCPYAARSRRDERTSLRGKKPSSLMTHETLAAG